MKLMGPMKMMGPMGLMEFGSFIGPICPIRPINSSTQVKPASRHQAIVERIASAKSVLGEYPSSRLAFSML